MKKIILLLILLVLAVYLIFQLPAQADLNLSFFQSVCSKPLAVRIGSVDPRYNLSQDEVLSDVKQAMQIWNKSYGHELLVYDPNAKLPINFVFDERQDLINQTTSATSQVNNLAEDVKKQTDDLNQQKSSLDKQYQQLGEDEKKFQQKYNNFKDEISYWKSRGGIPQEEYQKLVDEQNDLKKESEDLNTRLKQLQDSNNKFNSQIDPYKSQVQDLQNQTNQLIEISQNAGQALTQNPEEGVYESNINGRKIDIYFIPSQIRLVETLSHEMGHALGLEHNQDIKSIMYPFIQGTLTPSSTDLKDLAELCREKSLPEIFLQRAQIVISFYAQLIQNHFAKN